MRRRNNCLFAGQTGVAVWLGRGRWGIWKKKAVEQQGAGRRGSRWGFVLGAQAQCFLVAAVCFWLC